MPRVDLAAIGLALVAIARDGQARSVHVSSASLTAPGFVGDVQRRLEAAPGAASRLTLEVGEGGSIERALPRLREAWTPAGGARPGTSVVHYALLRACANPLLDPHEIVSMLDMRGVLSGEQLVAAVREAYTQATSGADRQVG